MRGQAEWPNGRQTAQSTLAQGRDGVAAAEGVRKKKKTLPILSARDCQDDELLPIVTGEESTIHSGGCPFNVKKLNWCVDSLRSAEICLIHFCLIQQKPENRSLVIAKCKSTKFNCEVRRKMILRKKTGSSSMYVAHHDAQDVTSRYLTSELAQISRHMGFFRKYRMNRRARSSHPATRLTPSPRRWMHLRARSAGVKDIRRTAVGISRAWSLFQKHRMPLARPILERRTSHLLIEP